MSNVRKPFVFIVYQDFEADLAERIQVLLKDWGYDVFQCRQTDRVQKVDGKAYRDELAENMRKCDLVLLLLSREFRWSGYCQAEVGATMALEKPYIPILIPPAEVEEVEDIAVALHGIQILNAGHPKFISLLQGAVVEALHQNKDSLRKLISRLQELDKVDVSTFAPTRAEQDDLNRASVEDALKAINQGYQLYQPIKTLVTSWPNLKDPACRSSVIGNIVRTLTGAHPDVLITLVGVSLKYSVHFIQDALEKVAALERIGDLNESSRGKKLIIRLIYMDDQSHILHALEDTRDMASIQRTLGRDWNEKKTAWKKLCGDYIALSEPVIHRIDYIPPRVGILIESGDEAILYAGRCAFNQTHRHSSVFTLDVGENEYLMYRRTGHADKNHSDGEAIEQFRSCVNAYLQPRNNSGIVPVWESGRWIQRLGPYIDEACRLDGLHDPECSVVTFISGSCTVFESLVGATVRKGVKVVAYVHDPGTPPKRSKALYERLERNQGKEVAKAVELRRYRHPTTFRAVVIGKIAIGLQTYVNAGDDVIPGTRRQADPVEPIKKLPLCFIITPYSEYFEQFRHAVLSFASDDPIASGVLRF